MSRAQQPVARCRVSRCRASASLVRNRCLMVRVRRTLTASRLCFFAGDGVLFAHDLQTLQEIAAVLEQVLSDLGFAINTSKTECMVIPPLTAAKAEYEIIKAAAVAFTLKIAGDVVWWVNHFRYLGTLVWWRLDWSLEPRRQRAASHVSRRYASQGPVAGTAAPVREKQVPVLPGFTLQGLGRQRMSLVDAVGGQRQRRHQGADHDHVPVRRASYLVFGTRSRASTCCCCASLPIASCCQAVATALTFVPGVRALSRCRRHSATNMS